MRRSIPALAAAAALTFALTGCSSSDSADKVVTVVGSGEVRGAPDILNADIGIEVSAPDVSAAVDSGGVDAAVDG